MFYEGGNMPGWQWSWWLKVGDDFGMLVTEYWCGWHILNGGARHLCIKIVDVGDRNDSNLNQHPKIFTITFHVAKICHQHRYNRLGNQSSKNVPQNYSATDIEVILRMMKCWNLKSLKWKKDDWFHPVWHFRF